MIEPRVSRIRLRGGFGSRPEPAETTLRSEAMGVLRLGIPVYFSLLATVVASVVDTAVLGRYDTRALAAFAVAFGVFGPATAAITGAVRGVTPFVAESADKPLVLAAVLRDGMRLSLLLGGVGAIGVLNAATVGRWTGVPVAILAELGPVTWLLALALLVSSVGHAATFSLTALGRRRAVLLAGLAGASAICVLSPVLVHGLIGASEFGLSGTGVALLVATTLQSALLCRALSGDGGEWGRLFGPGSEGWKDAAGGLVRIAALGLPTAGTVLVKFGTFGYLALVAAGLGATSGAAHSISDSLLRLTFTAAVAVGMATVPPVSRAAGRADGPGALRSASSGLLVVVLALFVTAGAVWLASGWVIGAYTDDHAVRATVFGVLGLVLVVLLLDGVQAVLGFALTAVKHTLPSLGLFVAVFGALVVCAPAVSDAHGLSGLWAGLALANLALVMGQGALLLRRVRSFASPLGGDRTSGCGSG